jgi:serine/threonine protein kinase
MPDPRSEPESADIAQPAESAVTGTEAIVLEPGTRPLPEYELVRKLGQGGFGQVWQARGPGGFQVALKFIWLGGQAARVEMRSLELMKHVRHAHLLSQSGAWQRGGYLIIAMELADRSLQDRLNECPTGIPAAELWESMREAAKGNDYLSERRHPSADGSLMSILHKDIKPLNLLLVGGAVKVADFGLARLLETTVNQVTGGQTPAFAAPEFFRGEATPWSDQYSLAVSYCLLRGGRLPFDGDYYQIVGGHLTGQPDLTMLPEAERPTVARALAKEPRERWPSCRAFVEALTASGKVEPSQQATSGQPEIPDHLQVFPIAPVTLWDGEHVRKAVSVLNQGPAESIELRLEGLPKGVTAEVVRIPTGGSEGELVLAAAPGTAPCNREVKLVTTHGEPRIRQQFLLTVANRQAQARALEEFNKLCQIYDPATKQMQGLLSLAHTPKLRDAVLIHLSALPLLQFLKLSHTPLTDVGLSFVQGLAHLKDLNLGHTKVTDAGLASLKNLSQLQSLNLQATGITDAGLIHLQNLTNLRYLYLDANARIMDPGLVHLRNLSQLERLALSETGVTDAGLDPLGSLPRLSVLGLAHTRITDRGLAILPRLSSLYGLALVGTQITDAGLAHLEALPKLENLEISGCRKITDAGLVHLQKFGQLKRVWLAKTGISREGAKQLKKMLPGLQVFGAWWWFI